MTSVRVLFVVRLRVLGRFRKSLGDLGVFA